MRFKDFMAMAMALVGFVIVVLAITWIFQGNDFFLAKVFQPAMEDVRRETYEDIVGNDLLPERLKAAPAAN